MPAAPMDVALALFPPALREGRLDMRELIEEEGFWEKIAEILDPEAEVEFITPDAGGMGGMAGPFRGVEGFRAGWREWLEPFDRFRIELAERHLAPDERVVLLATTFGTLQGSSIEVEQPAAVVYTIRDGRIVGAAHYLDQQQALRDAGLA